MRRLLDGGNSRGPLQIAPNQKARILDLRGGDCAAEVISVVIQAPAREAGSVVVRPFVTVNFGGGGVGVSAEIDAGSGIIFTVPTGTLEIDGNNGDIPGTVGGVPVHGTTIAMGAYAAYGDLNRQVKLTRTRYLDAVPPVPAPVPFTVPQFGATLNVVRTPIADGYTIRLLDGAGNPIGDYAVAGGAQFPGPVELPDDTSVVTITPPADPAFVARLIFGLDI